MDYSGGFGPAGALANVSRFFSKPFLNSSGRIDLAKVGLASWTAKSALNIFANYRQLRHTSSPAYRAPEHWGLPTDNTEKDAETSHTKAFNKIKHRLRMEILTWSSSLIINGGMLFGGYDRLWKVCEGAAIVGAGTTDSLTGRILSTTLFAFGTIAIEAVPELALGPAYRYFTSTSTLTSYESLREGMIFMFANAWYIKDPEKRDALIRSPAWKQWTITGCALASITLVPTMMISGVYEALGPNAVAPMVKTVGFATAAFLTLVNGPLAWRKLKRLTTKTSDEDLKIWASWPTLAEWSQGKELKIAPGELQRKITAMLPESLQIQVLVQPASTEELNEKHPSPLEKLVVPKVKTSRQQHVICLCEVQLETLDLEEHLALVAEAILKSGKLFRIIYLDQLSIISKIIPYPLFHQYYTGHPEILRDIFPNYRAESTRHTPLAVSWTTTSCLVAGFDFISDFARYDEMRSILRDDRRIAELGPEHARGLSKMLRKRNKETLEQQESEWFDSDIGSMAMA